MGCSRGKEEVVEEGEGEDGYVPLGLVVYLRLGGVRVLWFWVSEPGPCKRSQSTDEETVCSS